MLNETQKTDFMRTLIDEQGGELRSFAQREYRKRGRGIVILQMKPAPSWVPFIKGAAEIGVIGRGYATIADVEANGGPDDYDVLELLHKYDPVSQVCYVISWRDGSVSIGRFGPGALEDPTPGMTEVKRPTVQDAIFGKPQNARDN